jgi:hypothetical protein
MCPQLGVGLGILILFFTFPLTRGAVSPRVPNLFVFFGKDDSSIAILVQVFDGI